MGGDSNRPHSDRYSQNRQIREDAMNSDNLKAGIFFPSQRKGMTYNLFHDFDGNSPYYTSYILRSSVFAEVNETNPLDTMFPNT